MPRKEGCTYQNYSSAAQAALGTEIWLNDGLAQNVFFTADTKDVVESGAPSASITVGSNGIEIISRDGNGNRAELSVTPNGNTTAVTSGNAELDKTTAAKLATFQKNLGCD